MTPDTIYTLYFSTYHNESSRYNGTTRGVRRFISERCAELAIDGATLSQPEGMWRGQWEHSYALMIVGDAAMLPAMHSLADDIGEFYKQESVMLTYVDADVEFI